MSAPTIRELAEADLEALLSLYADLHADDAPAERAELERTWGVLMADPAHLYMGAFVDGALVSACNAAVIANLTRGARPYAVIENVVTRADMRGRGLASATMGALIERCRARRCYKIMLMSASDRSGAHDFYERLGFDGDAKRAFVLKP